MSRGVWTVTAMRDTFIQDSAVCGHEEVKEETPISVCMVKKIYYFSYKDRCLTYIVIFMSVSSSYYEQWGPT